ncbi:glucose-6-phosphatase 2-like [Tachypleus tridentatus]|uniref:glucose-6-phosphatase 2-like n=1 Tax=Tachypleus tridentatus TaxID=6853 RepID=UPI003FCF6977
MDFLHKNSISAIEMLQTRFQQQQNAFFTISNLADPRYAFLIYAPLVFSFDWKIGKQLIWVIITAEWSNQLLKWILHGERPYWWVHDTDVYNKTGAITPVLQQYFMTCETGPGNPSGHAMVTAAVWYILVNILLEKSGGVSTSIKNLITSVCWTAYTLLLCVVSLSRVYIAAHFPHQCFLGIIFGFYLALTMTKISLDGLKLRHYVIMTISLFVSALSTYFALWVVGLNPLWSVERAMKWCVKQEYIRLDTTPFFSVMRYCGYMLGLGVGLNSRFNREAAKVHFTPVMKLWMMVLSVTLSMMLGWIPLPRSSAVFFYISTFLINIFLPVLFVALVPYGIIKGKSTFYCLSEQFKKEK